MISQQVKVIGTKTHEAIEAAWLADFRAPSGRPEGEGWLTISEMAALAKCSVSKMHRFVKGRPAGYWSVQSGFVRLSAGVRRAATFYRKAPALTST